MFYFIKIFSLISLSNIIIKAEEGKESGAYLKTPDAKQFQYRLGNAIGYYGNGWNDSKLSDLSRLAGYDGQKKRLIEFHFNNWGYDIEIDDCQKNKEFGILDVVGYLGYPIKSHSSNVTGNPDLCYPANLYKSIWLDDGSINPDNYWANYVYKTVSKYKNYIKIWQVWNEPDSTTNYENIKKWNNEAPNKDDLNKWHGTIFEYIRLLRITYEVAKKIDPECWVSTGGIKFPQFLDAIMRYTDNPDGGKLTGDYPAYGGAYFDCDALNYYPNNETTDLEAGINYNNNGSDILAKKIVILKKIHNDVIKKYGFGEKYPEKIFIITETGINSKESNITIGGDLIRRNWILKLSLYSLEYDIKQIHMPYLADNFGGMGDFENLGKFTSINEGLNKLKSSSKGRTILKKINLGKYIFDLENTEKFRQSLPNSMTGIALKRKFPKESNENYDYEYIYSVWLYCEKDELTNSIDNKIDLPFDPLVIDWEGNENKKIQISSTPIFLLGNISGTSGFVIFLKVIGILLLLIIIIGISFYLFKRYKTKKRMEINDELSEGLTQN